MGEGNGRVEWGSWPKVCASKIDLFGNVINCIIIIERTASQMKMKQH